MTSAAPDLALVHAGRGWWRIKHRPTGLTLTPHRLSKSTAVDMVQQLSTLDWSSAERDVLQRHGAAVWAALRQAATSGEQG